jgi:hypothetical protein
LHQSETIQVGDRVEILQPSYLVGKTGIVCGKEELSKARSGDRWLVRVIPDEFVVSLTIDEFRALDS